jgi:hypothetical protein
MLVECGDGSGPRTAKTEQRKRAGSPANHVRIIWLIWFVLFLMDNCRYIACFLLGDLPTCVQGLPKDVRVCETI